MIVQQKAAAAQIASPSKMAKELDQQRKRESKRVAQFVKQLLDERVQEQKSGNAAKGNRKKKQSASTQELPENADA